MTAPLIAARNLTKLYGARTACAGASLDLHEGEHVSGYILRKVKEGQIFVGCEGEEPDLAYGVRRVGPEPWVFSSD